MTQPVNTINSFNGEYSFLSNFHHAKLTYDGLTYYNAEAAYQAAKSADWRQRVFFCTLTGAQAKASGQKVELRPYWDLLKINIMTEISILKFAYNPDLKTKLLATGNARLIEGNYWGDTYWGICKGKGANHLGIILEAVRSMFKDDRSHESSFRDCGTGI